MAASEDMYKASQEQAPPQAEGDGQDSGQASTDKKKEDNVQDVPFEEVK